MKLSQEKILELHRDYLSGMPIKEIVLKHSFPKTCVYRLVAKLGKRENPRKIKNVNHTFFNNLGEIQCYLLGFYLGDGNLNIIGNSYSIGVSVSREDSYILELFKKYISPDSKITYSIPKSFISVNGKKYQGKEQGLIRITSSLIGKYLVDLGFGKNKTRLVKNLPNLDKDQFRHFLRGYFDADGCVMCAERKEGWMNYRFQLTSFDKKILEDIVSKLHEFNIKSKIYSEKNHYHILTQSRKEVTNLYYFLYDDVNFFLKRKKDKFQKIEKIPSDFKV